MLKSAYGEECLSRTSVFGITGSKEGKSHYKMMNGKGHPSTYRTKNQWK
jgi:hypothetical protein